jgi:glycosyltransferase involved in cell wall biosynthesis
MTNLYFLLVHPAPYHEFFLQKLEKELGGHVNIQVFFMQGTNSMYPWKSNFRNGFKSTVLSGHFLNSKLLEKIVKDRNATFILVGWERLDKIFLISLLSILGRKYLIYTDTPHDKRIRSFLKTVLRNSVLKFIAKTSYGLIVTGNIGVRVVKNWPFKFKRVINLPTFVDHDYFKPGIKLKREENQIRIFSSGRLFNAEKGYDIALLALAALKKNAPGKKYLYEIAGEGPDRSSIESLIRQLDLSNEVQLLGWAEPALVLNKYQNCDFFLHSSRQDAYPNAIMEAMACGCIVISSDNAGSAVDRIVHEKSGYLFKSGDPESLTQVLSLAIENTMENSKIIAETLNVSNKWAIPFGIQQIESILNDTSISD